MRSAFALKEAEVARAAATMFEAEAEEVRCDVRVARRARSKTTVPVVRAAAAAELAAAKLNAALARAVLSLSKTALSYAKLSLLSDVSININTNTTTTTTVKSTDGELANACSRAEHGEREKRARNRGKRRSSLAQACNGTATDTSVANCEDESATSDE